MSYETRFEQIESIFNIGQKLVKRQTSKISNFKDLTKNM